MQIVFQDPYGSLNPRMTIESALTEPMVIHGIGTHAGRAPRPGGRAAAKKSTSNPATSAATRTNSPAASGNASASPAPWPPAPSSSSATNRSRRSTSRVQAQVLNLLKDLQDKRGLTYIFISHDLSVVKFMADMMAVMNDGKIVEFGPSEKIYANPHEEYTRRLIDATPKDDLELIRKRVAEREKTRANSAKIAASDKRG